MNIEIWLGTVLESYHLEDAALTIKLTAASNKEFQRIKLKLCELRPECSGKTC